MKKALIVLLILAVAGGLFAQTFSGSVNTGAKITFKDDMPVVATDDDSGDPVHASLSFTNGDDDWGVTVGVNADVTKVDEAGKYTAGPYSFGDANGWVKFADIFKLTAGKGQGGNWQFNDIIDEGIDGSDAGARLNVTPIPGLDLGIVFGYPDYGVKADQVANFFQEIGIGAKYDAGILIAGTSLKLFSEESEGYEGTDANWWLDIKVPIANLFDIMVDVAIKNLTGKGGDMDKTVGAKIAGSVVGLSWNVWAKAGLNDETTATAGAGLSYGIPISDKASAEIGADAGLTLLQDASFDSWSLYAKLAYAFNANVSTFFKLKVAGDQTVDPSTVTPTLQWNIGYSF